MKTLTINLMDLRLEIALDDVAIHKNVFGYDSISNSVAKCFGTTVSEIMVSKTHVDYHGFIQVRNAVISKLWGW